MKNYKYPELNNFFKENYLVSNQIIPCVIEGKLLSSNLMFQDLDEESNLLFVSLGEDSDCVAIDLNKIDIVELSNKRIWYRKIFNHVN